MADRSLSIINAIPRLLDGPDLLHHLVPLPSAHNLDDVAIEHHPSIGSVENWTYGSLHAVANNLASRLIHQKPDRPQFVIPIFLRQSAHLYISQLAILKAGAAFCPLPLDVPQDRLRFILQDVGAGCLVTNDDTLADLPDPGPGISIISIDNILKSAVVDPIDQPCVSMKPTQAAYIMYTSGSTGKPKGVVISHKAAVQALLAHDDHIPQFSRFLQFASPTFDVSIFEIFFTFFRGSTLISSDRRRLINDLPRFIRDFHIDATELTPSVVSALVHNRDNVPSLKLLLTIGEMLRKDVIREFGGTADKSALLYGMYGPTETTIHCTIQPAFKVITSPKNIGFPLDTVSVFVMKPVQRASSDEMEIVARGTQGELVIGGHQLADGYLNRSEQTAASFICHPIYGRLYRTGDLAVIGVDGSIECHGRISDGQVKLRGQRIELGEIEYAASRTTGCTSAVVEVVDGLLVAFCVTSSKSTTRESIQEACRKWLPEFMVPSEILCFDMLPYLPSGKVDRRSLISKLKDPQRLSPGYGSLSETGKEIAGIIKPILQSSPISQETNLATIGLDSLSAIRLSSALSRKGFPLINASHLLGARSIAGIESLLLERLDSESSPNRSRQMKDGSRREPTTKAFETYLSKFAQADVEHVYFCTPMQCAMLAETQRNQEAYRNSVTLQIRSFDHEQVTEAVIDLLESEEIFRTGFIPIEGFPATHIGVVFRNCTKSLGRWMPFCDNVVESSDGSLLRTCKFRLRKKANLESELVIRIHHALYDQWAFDLLKLRLVSILNGRKPASTPTFRTVATYYLDTASEFQSETSIEFWQNSLRNFVPTPLPRLNPRRSKPSSARSSWMPMSVALARLREQCLNLQCGGPAVYQMATAYVLSSYAGPMDFTLGIVMSGRHIPVKGIEQIIGPCMTTLPSRIDFSSASSITELLLAIHQSNRMSQFHSLIPLAEIKRIAGCSPRIDLFDSLFVWQETSLDTGNLSETVTEIETIDKTEFNLVLEFEPRGSSIYARATYRQDILPDQQIEILLGQIDHVAKAILSDPGSSISQLNDSFDAPLLSIANANPQSFADQSAVSMIESWARRAPLSPAVSFAIDLFDHNRVETWTYKYLNSFANSMARFLLTQGARSDAPIGIWMDKSITMYGAMLSTWKVGCGYLPLTVDIPSSRAANVFSQSNVRFCICDDTTFELVHDINGVQAFNLNDFNAEEFPDHDLETTTDNDTIAYTIYTSGSTGVPKGVPISFKNINGNIAVLTQLYNVKTTDRLLQMCSHAFDVSVFEIFFTLANGMCLCAARKDLLLQDIEHCIRTFNITHLSLTPTVAALIHPDNVPSVRFVVTAGEGITEAVQRRWAGRGLHQGYGPSETTNICTLNMNMHRDDQLGNLGTVFPNVSGFVIGDDTSMAILPSGAIGEFAFGGEQVFTGYFGRQDLNSLALIQHPQYGRIYRSGDMGRMTATGTFIFSGRKDDQIKLRGNRIEIEEIGHVLLQSDKVVNAATVIIAPRQSAPSLATFWVPTGLNIDTRSLEFVHKSVSYTDDLFSLLDTKLPQYMIPSQLVPITRIPLTAQSKVDKRLLASFLHDLDADTYNRISRNSGEGKDDCIIHWSDEERQLAVLLSDTLQISSTQISRNSSFFALGLNSFNVIEFAKRIRDVLKVSVAFDSILKNPTVARLSCELHTRPHDDSETTSGTDELLSWRDLAPFMQNTPIFDEAKIQTILPCTPLQEAMLMAIDGHVSAYCNLSYFRVNGDLQRLRACWQVMVNRHDILRTSFLRTEHPDHPFVQIVFRHRELPWDDGGAYLNGNTISVEGSRISISEPCQILQRNTCDETHLILQMHHAIYDGISLAQLLDEVESCYRNEALPRSLSFTPFLKHAQTHKSSKSMSYWSEILKTFDPKPFPKQSHDAHHTQQKLTHTLHLRTHDFERSCTRHAVTQLSFLQAAWAKTLSYLQDAQDICFGNVVSGRTIDVEGLDRLVAPCFNTLPVRIDLSLMLTNIDLVRKMHQHNLSSLKYQLAPLRKVQALSNIPHERLFDSLILLQPPSRNRDNQIWTATGDDGIMDMALVLEIIPRELDWILHLHFNPAVVDTGRAEMIGRAFDAAMKSCIEYPASSIQHFSKFGEDELAGLLANSDKGTTHLSIVSDSSPDVWSEEETVVRDAFASLSNVAPENITRHTPLYRLGLDSLHAIQLAMKLKNRGFAITAADILRLLTPAAIAEAKHVRAEKETGPTQLDFSKFDAAHRDYILHHYRLQDSLVESIRPCTDLQCGLLAQSIHAEGALYINHLCFAIPDHVTLAMIEQSWQLLQRKHQALRMGFVPLERDNHFAMVIYNASSSVSSLIKDSKLADLEETRIESQRAIIKNLHEPAWRYLVLQHDNQLILILSMHHALYDANALHCILRDFKSAIQGDEIGTSPPIDSVLGLNLGRSVSETDRAKSYWTNLLTDYHATKFPNLCPNVIQKKTQKVCSLSAGFDRTHLESRCRQLGVTIQSVGQAAWATLLSAYTGEARIIFGTIFSTRGSEEGSDVVFPCISTVPVMAEVTGTYESLVSQMLKQNADGQEYRFLSLDRIQRATGRAGQALFDTVFVHQRTKHTGLNWPSLREDAAAEYTVSLELETVERDDFVTYRLTFDESQIPLNQANKILRQYQHLLTSFIDTTEREPSDVAELYSITPAKDPILPSESDYLHEMVRHAAIKYPNRCALQFFDTIDGSGPKSRQWSFTQLESRANQVAYLLRENGVKRGDIVAVCMGKSPEASFAFLGILKAGCSFLAMDPDLPVARKTFILQDSQTALLFVSSGQSLAGDASAVKTVELSEKVLSNLPDSCIQTSLLDAHATCYNLYTSGTTGNPKGCEITHENAVQAMLAFRRLFDGHWDENSKWLQFASYWFDVSILEHFWTWGLGLTVVGAPRDLVLEDISKFIRVAQITHIDLTPSLARLVHPDDVPTLHNHVFITGGEPIKQEIIDAWGPKHTVCNGYGPTEATIGVTMHRFLGSDTKPSNIGPQFDNVGTLVLMADSDEPVLRGAVGELCITGKLVGKGYLNRPDLTEKAFPFLDRFQEKTYRTGDLVRILHDGSFSFIGRKDTQAKLRGQRLEIEEIESIIKGSSKAVVDVVCNVIKSSRGEHEVLVAFISLAKKQKDFNVSLELQTSATATEIMASTKQACIDQLPAYMVPTYFMPIAKMPLTVNNKIDGKKLVAFFNSISVAELQNIKPIMENSEVLDSTQRHICNILGKVLDVDVDSMQPSSNIFSIGLSSISAIVFTKRLQSSGFENANLTQVMNNPTIARLSKSLQQMEGKQPQITSQVRQSKLAVSAFAQKWRHTVTQRLNTSMDNIEAISPCTPLQEGMLLDSLRRPNKPYFNDFRYRLTEIDSERLSRAFDLVVCSLQILRTKFLQTNAGFLQVVTRESLRLHITSNVLDIDGFLREHRQQWLDMNLDDVHHPFSAILVSNSKSTILVFHAHHALYDGISWQLFIDELQHTYKHGAMSDLKGSPGFLEALPYGPLWNPAMTESFWRPRIARLKRNNKQYDVDPVDKSVVSKVVKITNMASIEQSRKSLGVSHQSIVQASFEVALLQLSPETTTYGQVVSGRAIDVPSADKIVGPLFNTIPNDISIDSSAVWTGYIANVQQCNTATLPYQHTPIRAIKKWVGCQLGEELFDTLFVFQINQQSVHGRSNNGWEVLDQSAESDFGLAFEATLTVGKELMITIIARKASFSEEKVNKLMETFQKALEIATTKPSSRISEDFELPKQDGDMLQQKNAPKDARETNLSEFQWTEDASTIQRAIAEMGGVDQTIIDENSAIFALGLDSIDAVKLSSRLRQCGLNISMSKIIQAQTIPKMLEAVVRNPSATDSETRSSVLIKLEEQAKGYVSRTMSNQDSIERVLPVAPNQEALIADMIRSDFKEYYNHAVLLIADSIDLIKLQNAWQSVVEQTPVLRTGFIEVTDHDTELVFAQIIYKPGPIKFDVVHLDTPPEFESIQEGIRVDIRDAVTTGNPLLRLSVVECPTARYLILSLSHAQYDGHSLALIHEDVQRAYAGKSLQRPSCYSVLELALESTSKECFSFWENKLADLQSRKFPINPSDKHRNTVYRAERSSNVNLESARELCRTVGCSMQTLAQTAWAIILAQYTKSLEVCFGIVLACRHSEESEDVIFPTMNTVPMRAFLHGTLKELLQYIQSESNEILPYQQTPLRRIQQASRQANAESTSDTLSIFDTLFIYQQRPPVDDEALLPLYESIGGSADVDYPVAAEIEVLDGKIILRTACKSTALDEIGANSLLRHLDSALDMIVKHTENSVVEFSDAGASICGSASLELADDPIPNDSATQQYDTEVIENDMPATILDVRRALAQVAKVPESTIVGTTSIESIGVDSISAIKLTSILRKSGYSISVSELLRARTLNQIASKLEQTKKHDKSKPGRASAEIVSGAVRPSMIFGALTDLQLSVEDFKSILPATAGQAYMINTWLSSGGQLFAASFVHKLYGTIDEETIDKAWEKLRERHDIMRTIFYSTRDSTHPLLQIVLTPQTSSEKLVKQKPMAKLTKSQGLDAWTLQISLHHALYDAVSLDLLMTDFQILLRGDEKDLSPMQFTDFLGLSVTTQAKEQQKQFWTRYLADVQQATLSDSRQFGSDDNRIELWRPTFWSDIPKLEAKARQFNVATHSILLAAFAKLYATMSLAEETKDHDVVLGIYLSNRSHLADLPHLSAPTLNLVPLRVKSVNRLSLTELAQQIQLDLNEIGNAVNSAVGLWEVAEWTGVKLDCFINLVKLPEAEAKVQRSPWDSTSIDLVEFDESKTTSYSKTETPTDQLKFPIPDQLKDIYGADTYLPSLDFEASITGANLNVGLFCPQHMLGIERAEELLHELRTLLNSML